MKILMRVCWNCSTVNVDRNRLCSRCMADISQGELVDLATLVEEESQNQTPMTARTTPDRVIVGQMT